MVWQTWAQAAGDQSWDQRFYFFGLRSGERIAVVAVNESGHLFAGGSFSSVAGLNGTENIAHWDGQKWYSLLDGLDGEVRAIVANGQDVFVGGTFSNASGVAATNLARWDGTNWWSLGKGVQGEGVYALAMLDNTLYVGGTFTNAGGQPVQNLAAWNGDHWSDLDGGISGLGSPIETRTVVSALRVANGQVTAAGNFASAGGILASNIAAWNGTSWTNLSSGLRGPVQVLATDPAGLLYAGGGDSAFGPPYIAYWNGVSWSYLDWTDPGLNAAVRVIFFYNDALYAGALSSGPLGKFDGLSRWDGANWVKEYAPFYPVTTVPARHGDSLYFGGTLNYVMAPRPDDGGQFIGLAQYDGKDWTILGAGAHYSANNFRSLLMNNGDLIAGGYFFTDVSMEFNRDQLVARWNGQIWSMIGNQIGAHDHFGYLLSTFALARSESIIYAGGSFRGSNSEFQRIAGWNGTNWFALGEGLPSTVYSIAVRNEELFAGANTGVYAWTGSNWVNLGTSVGGAVYALAIHGSDLFAGGLFSSVGGQAANNVARWDGTNWWPLGAGVDGRLNALALWKNNLVAAGTFTNAGNSAAHCVAVWDGSNWKSLGSGFSGGFRDVLGRLIPTTVNALAVRSNDLIYAAGNFTSSGNLDAAGAAYWDGANWQPLGSGLDAQVYALALDGQDLYLAGDFYRAGGTISSRIALWHGGLDERLPLLSIAQLEGKVVLEWSAEFSDFFLESTKQFRDDSIWESIQHFTLGQANVATNETSNHPQFYRLRRF